MTMDTSKLMGIVEELTARDASWVSKTVDALGEITVFTPAATILDICKSLRDDHGFDMLADLCASDRGPEDDPRFEVNYHLFSTTHYGRIRLKVLLTEDNPKVESVVGLWKTANWHEREAYDMLGVIFDNHPNLKRILLPSDFDGHALRKDYPLRGYEPYSLT